MSDKSQIKLSKYEENLEKQIKKGEYVSGDVDKVRDVFAEAAKNYRELRKSKKITVRINKQDLLAMKAKAKENKIPYQTLLSLLVNKYVKGDVRLEI